ncbi:retrovirus-related pol polyprotein from transposon TNT 1-94 [Tanacetum coccineum]|uniref:Retrovirus-related pol polyprotein from transposon TNT 1-94 n=1 Tax=Tanacetum coccineum TaxID=301880 RepID=A0ABQ4WS69_9ASTR
MPGYEGALNRAGEGRNANPGQARQLRRIEMALDEEQLYFLQSGGLRTSLLIKDVDEPTCSGFRLNDEDNDHVYDVESRSGRKILTFYLRNKLNCMKDGPEDTLEIAEITRRKMHDKMKDLECVTHKVKIAPPDYSKENYLATFTPQKQLTPEQFGFSRHHQILKQKELSKSIHQLNKFQPKSVDSLVVLSAKIHLATLLSQKVLSNIKGGRIDHPLFCVSRLFQTFEWGWAPAPGGMLNKKSLFSDGSRCSNLYTIWFEDHVVKLLSNLLVVQSLQEQIMVVASAFKPLELCIFHQKTVPRTPQQNGVIERRNRTLVEAAKTMLVFSKALMFLWAEAVVTAVFGALCYPTNDSKDLGKLQPITDIGIFVGYAPSRKGTGPAPTFLMPGQISLRLIPNQVPAAPYVPPPPLNKDLEILFQPMFDEYLEPPRVERPVSPAPAIQVPVNSTAESPLMEDNPFALIGNDHFIIVFALEPSSEASSSRDLSSTESPYVSQTLHHLGK